MTQREKNRENNCHYHKSQCHWLMIQLYCLSFMFMIDAQEIAQNEISTKHQHFHIALLK